MCEGVLWRRPNSASCFFGVVSRHLALNHLPAVVVVDVIRGYQQAVVLSRLEYDNVALFLKVKLNPFPYLGAIAALPCAMLRRNYKGIDVSKVPLFCSQEAYIRGGLKKVIRLLLSVYMEEGSVPENVYLGGAEVLRPDFCKK